MVNRALTNSALPGTVRVRALRKTKGIDRTNARKCAATHRHDHCRHFAASLRAARWIATQRLSRAKFRAWHRGTREADYLVGGFFDQQSSRMERRGPRAGSRPCSTNRTSISSPGRCGRSLSLCITPGAHDARDAEAGLREGLSSSLRGGSTASFSAVREPGEPTHPFAHANRASGHLRVRPA